VTPGSSARHARASDRRARRRRADITSAVVARTLAWTHRLTFRAAFRRLLAGEDRRAVAADLRAQADRAYDLLERGLAEYWR
jgi:hypothetical protein